MLLWPKAPTQSEVDWERDQFVVVLKDDAAECASTLAYLTPGPWKQLVRLSVMGCLDNVDWDSIAEFWIR